MRALLFVTATLETGQAKLPGSMFVTGVEREQQALTFTATGAGQPSGHIAAKADDIQCDKPISAASCGKALKARIKVSA